MTHCRSASVATKHNNPQVKPVVFESRSLVLPIVQVSRKDQKCKDAPLSVFGEHIQDPLSMLGNTDFLKDRRVDD
jgi:hypothetical protein